MWNGHVRRGSIWGGYVMGEIVRRKFHDRSATEWEVGGRGKYVSETEQSLTMPPPYTV